METRNFLCRALFDPTQDALQRKQVSHAEAQRRRDLRGIGLSTQRGSLHFHFHFSYGKRNRDTRFSVVSAVFTGG